LKTQVEKAYDRHTKWLEITRSFGGLRETEVQDIVQELYLLLIRNTQKGVDFSYGDNDINYYYCFRILRGLYVDLMRKKLKYTFTDLEGIQISDTNDVNYVEAYEKIQEALKQIFWYDRKVYEIIEEQGISISELSRKTDISYYSLYNTYTKVKSKLKDLI
jgi:DNA-directed RNA polymerase specialized sigma24 family protein